MGRLKKASDAYTKALKRAAALKSIDPNLDLGNGVSLANLELAMADTKSAIDEYNTELSKLDLMLNNILPKEAKLRDLYARTLTGIATKYGKDSNEYEQAGGVRLSERKRKAVKKNIEQ